MPEIYTFKEHDVTLSAEKHHLIDFAESVYDGEFDTIWNDLAYKILSELDEDFQKEVEHEITE